MLHTDVRDDQESSLVAGCLGHRMHTYDINKGVRQLLIQVNQRSKDISENEEEESTEECSVIKESSKSVTVLIIDKR